MYYTYSVSEFFSSLRGQITCTCVCETVYMYMHTKHPDSITGTIPKGMEPCCSVWFSTTCTTIIILHLVHLSTLVYKYMTLLACFFHLSLKHVHVYMYNLAYFLGSAPKKEGQVGPGKAAMGDTSLMSCHAAHKRGRSVW